MPGIADTATQPVTLISLLLDMHAITAQQASLVPPYFNTAQIEQFLLSRQMSSPEAILQAYAKLYHIPYIRLTDVTIPAEVLAAIPELTARRYDIVPYDKKDDIVFVALATPGRMQSTGKTGVLKRLQTELGIKIAPAFAPLADIKAAHNQYAKLNPAKVVVPTEKEKAAIPQAPIGPTMTYPSITLSGKNIPESVIQKFPKEVILEYQIVPFEEPQKGLIRVALVNADAPGLKELLTFVETRNGIKLELFQTSLEDFTQAIAMLTGEKHTPAISPAAAPVVAPVAIETVTPKLPIPDIAPGEVSRIVAPAPQSFVTDALTGQPVTPLAVDEDNLDALLQESVTSMQDLITIVRSGNVPRMVAAILAMSIQMRASDVHLEAEKEKVRLRYRIDGELEDVLFLPRIILAPLVSRIKILSQMKIDENRIPQDGRFDVHVKDREIDIRVSTLPTVHGEKVVLRILDKTTGIMSLKDMGIEGPNATHLEENFKKSYGMILSTGPTGSGKTTTLYAILQQISQPEVNIVTLEDPVEYEVPGINQTQIKPKIGFTFAEGLRSILRQDPNIIMVGEIRDKETAEMATHASLTGHLVLSTLHTNSAAGAMPRLSNMGIEPYLITSSVTAVIGQRLARRICTDCKTELTLPPEIFEEVQKELEGLTLPSSLVDVNAWKFYHGKGCAKCHHGYRGRVGMFEVLTMSDSIEELVVKEAPASAIEEQAVKEGMVRLRQDGLIKALQGLTTVEEVMKVTAS